MALEQITVEYNLALEKAKAQFDSFVRQLTAKEAEIQANSKRTTSSVLVDVSKVARERKRAVIEGVKETKKADGEIVASAKKKTTELIKQTDKLEKNNANLITSFRSVATAVGIAFSVQQLLAFGSELLDIARKSEGVNRAFNNIANSQSLAALRAATGFGVSDLQLRQLAVRANTFKISLETLPTLLQFATIRAAETGQEVDYLVNSIIDGIGRQSPLILDNLGISAKELQVEFKRTGDFAQAVGNIIQKEMGNSVTSIEDAVTSTQKLNATWENTKETIAPLLANFINPGLEALNKGIKDAANSLGGFDTDVREITQALSIYGGDIDKIVAAYERFGTVNGDVIAKITKLREVTDTSNASYNNLRDTIKSFTSESDFGNLIVDLQKKILDFQDAGATASEAYLVLQTSLRLASDEYVRFVNKTQTPVQIVETLETLNAQLKNLKELFETTDINAPAFRQLQAEIKALEERIETIVNPTNAGSIARFEKELSKLEERLKNETSIQGIQDLEREIYLLTVRISALKNLDLNINAEFSEDLPKDIDEANKAAIRLIDNMQLLNKTELDELDKNLKNLSKTIDDLAGELTDEMWEEFKRGIDLAREASRQLDENIKTAALSIVNDLTNLFTAFSDQSSQALINQIDREKFLLQERQAILSDYLDQQVQAGRISDEEAFNQKQKYLEDLAALEQRQAEARRQQQRRAAIAEKANAAFNVIVNLQSGIAKTIGQLGVFAPAAIAPLIALAGVSLATIAATPIPEFAEGVVGLQGKGTGTSDDIPAMLSKGESVITAKATGKHKAELEAMNNGTYEKFVKQKYLVPLLMEKKRKGEQSFAENIARSMQQQSFDDTMLVHETRKNRNVRIANAEQIGRATAREMEKRSYFKNRI